MQFSGQITASGWDETVSSLGGSIFHSSVWASYSTAVESHLSPLYITCLDDQDIVVGAALAFAEYSTRRIVNLFSKRMLLYATPVVNNDDRVLAFFLSELESYCRKRGFARLDIASYASPDISEHLTSGGYDLTHRYEFILDLDQTEEQLWSGLSATLRKNINKAGKSGVTILELPVADSIASLEKLGKATADRILSRKGVDLRQSSSDKVKQAVLFMDQGLGRFLSAALDGEIISTSLFAQFNGIVCHMLAGANDEAMKAQASKLLLWQAITSYKAAGARTFNLGGCKSDATEPDSAEHGVYWFKKSFGARVVTCASGEKILGVKRARFFDLVRSIAGR